MDSRGCIPVQLPVPNPTPSYWHQPKAAIANYRSADSLPSSADYVIIGSGISGTMIAWNLLEKGVKGKIIMLEAREACGGATGRNGGHTKAASYRTFIDHCAHLSPEEALKIIRLEYANIMATYAFARTHRIECESRLCNTVDIVYDRETFERGKEAIEMIREAVSEEERKEGGVGWYRVWQKEEAMKRFWVSKENENGLVEEKEELQGAFEYVAGSLSAYRFAIGILELCLKKGLQLWTNTAVTKVRPIPGRADREIEGTGFRWEIHASDSIIRTQNVVMATNGYSAYLLPVMQGVIVPMRGLITTQIPGLKAKFPTPLPTTYSFLYKQGYEYMIPRLLPDGSGDQHIVIGGGLGRQKDAGVSEYGTCDDSTMDQEMLNYLKEAARGYFGLENWGETGGGEERIKQEWTGIMGMTRDELPLVGEVPGMKRLWISAGFNGHGMVLCLKSAEFLSHLIVGGFYGEIEWFPESFLVTEGRISAGKS
ncbi:FAD dependent oxidoreductase-like protein [Glonium stellatum]|uniref:FAD dependent oxidoreductase-like protein n=1 Tax=Glonium stellatum TaxID=574774 RepID=A0A8E2EWB7_9PEZI|nr:FAD dependent oxidoreductase-like protein [Glonium stellatum]